MAQGQSTALARFRCSLSVFIGCSGTRFFEESDMTPSLISAPQLAPAQQIRQFQQFR